MEGVSKGGRKKGKERRREGERERCTLLTKSAPGAPPQSSHS